MRKRSYRRALVRSVALGLATAAVVVPAAQARYADGGRATPAVVATTDSHASYYRALGLRSESLQALYRPTTIAPDDLTGLKRPGAPTATPIVVSAPSTGFDWTDAGVGAGSALLVIALLAGGLAVVARRTSKGQLAV